jgi:hypothetical protein
VNGYVEGLIEKAQSRAATQPGRPMRRTAPERLLPERETAAEEENGAELPLYQPVYFFVDSELWRSRAERALVRSRKAIMEHRRRQVTLCDASHRRIEASQSLLKMSVPVMLRWLATAS